jgi:IclR family acetate operon transcriptional repressor
MQILEVVAGDPEGLRLIDIVEAVGLPLSTAHRLLTTLQGRQFVQYDRLGRRWRVGLRGFQIGSGFIRESHYVQTATPILRRLRDATKATVNLGVQQGDAVIILSQFSGSLGKAVGPVGTRLPMQRSGLGKAILAGRGEMPPDVTSAAPVQQRLAIDLGELVRDVRCVAAPVYGLGAVPIGAISVSGNTLRFSDELVVALGKLVTEAAWGLTSAIGNASRTLPA